MEEPEQPCIHILLFITGELTKHMGCHDLERSYKELLEMHGHMASSPDKHGNGAGVVANIHRGSGVIAIPQPADCPARDVTDEELEACTWKLSLQHMPAPVIKVIAQQLESPVLVSMVVAFRNRSSEVRKKSRSDSLSREIAKTIRRRVPYRICFHGWRRSMAKALVGMSAGPKAGSLMDLSRHMYELMNRSRDSVSSTKAP